ncbi:hypothetical protein TI39_contig5907g00003 [Zymoseptoria brevis]|uniref:D-lactate dehydratase n=1 Tax=Zymoseptoria brevis TaxID=1047168 RepID=A0A0F4G7C5_9PEZI|nr:hypothetical protein TI39_contig5907g00003 [Zymoseptoria brevis]
MSPKVLFVLSSHDQMGNTGKPTGWYLPEMAHPYYKLEGEADITVVSPAGGKAPLDPASVEMFKEDAEAQQFLKEKSALWENTEKLSDYIGKASQFDAIFYVGGHGPMFDLATDEKSHQLIREFYEAGKVVSAVCHGPAAFAKVKLSDGSYLVNGAEVTGFSNTEEDQVQLSSVMPFMLEDELKKNGGKYVKADEPWGAKVVSSGKNGKLLTGQNPNSAGPIGEAILKALPVNPRPRSTRFVMKVPKQSSRPRMAYECVSGPSKKTSPTKSISITILAGIEEKPLIVDRDAMCAKSPFFASACSETWKEGQDKINKLPSIEPHIMENYILWATGKIIFFHRYHVSPYDAVVPQSNYVKLYIAAHYLLNEHLQDDIVDLLGHPLRSQKLILEPEIIALVWQQTARSFITSDIIIRSACGLQRLIMGTVRIDNSDAGDGFIEACGKDFDRDLRQDLMDLRDKI